MNEDGAAGLVLLGLIGVLLLFGIALGSMGAYLRMRVEAGATADAAALAAAPVTFLPFGAAGTAEAEAGRFTRMNGFDLISCVCPQDPSWEARTVTVTVGRTLRLWPIGTVTVEATSRAEFAPALLLDGPLEP